MLKKGKTAEALDLADMLLKALLSAHSIPLTKDVVDAVSIICGQVPPASAALGLRFSKTAIRWATNDAPVDPAPDSLSDESASSSSRAISLRGSDSKPSPAVLRHSGRVAQLHKAAARLAVSGGPEFYADAQRHYIEADCPEEFAGKSIADLSSLRELLNASHALLQTFSSRGRVRGTTLSATSSLLEPCCSYSAWVISGLLTLFEIAL